MADPVIASILSLATVIGRLFGPIKRFVDRVFEASKTIRGLKRELDQLRTMLTATRHHIESLGPCLALAKVLLEQIGDCRRTMRTLRNTLDELNGRALHWAMFGKDRVMNLRDALDRQRSILFESMLAYTL